MSDTETETIEDDKVCCGCECFEDVDCDCCGYTNGAYCMTDKCTSAFCCDCCEDAGCQSGCRKCWGVLCCTCLRCEPVDYLSTCKRCPGACAKLGMAFACIRKCMYGDPKRAPSTQSGKGCCGLCAKLQNGCGGKGILLIPGIIMAMCSILDTVTDSLLVYKWLSGHDPTRELFDHIFPWTQNDVEYENVKHKWEAYTLLGFLVIAWGTSAVFSLFWTPFQWSPNRDEDTYEATCPSKSKWCLVPFHLVGLGPTVETIKAFVNSDWDLVNARANINPYRWIEFCFESGPSALLALWIISKTNLKVHWDSDEQTAEDLRLENFTTFFNLAAMSSGICSMLVFHVEKDYGAKIAMDTSRPRAFCRWIGATLLIWADIIFRCFVIIIWMHFNPLDFLPLVNFLVVFGALFLIELVMVALNGQIAGCLQYPVVAYTSVYQGGLYYFSRTWEDEDHKVRTLPLFWIRWLVNVALYVVCFFVLADTNVNKYWNYGIIVSGSILPLLFYLKPSTKTFRETYPKVVDWQKDHDNWVDKKLEMAKQWFSSRTEATPRGNPASPTATSDMV